MRPSGPRPKTYLLSSRTGWRVFISVAISLGFVGWAARAQTGTALDAGEVYLPFIVKDQPEEPAPSFRETFDADPASPQSWQPANWDVTVHSRDTNNPESLTPMHAQHGSACDAPPATHLISGFDDAVFSCRNHVMTAIDDSGYGVIYLTPNALVDFSSGTATIQFDVSTLRTSSRDWIDLWITPFEDNLQLPLQSFYPDLSGPPRRAVHIFMDTFDGDTPFRAETYANFAPQSVEGNWWTGFEEFLEPSATRRDTFELRISRGHIKFGMPAYNFWWIDQTIPELDWSQGVVQFGHHSYTPEKDCIYPGGCGPNTWHWDNVSISPAVPFTIVRANRRYVAATTDPTVALASPAPTNAYLRFAAVGQSLQVSYDNGATWQSAQLQAQSKFVEEHFKSYWMPIPAGVSNVRFRGQPFWGGGWQIRDITVWSADSPSQ